jgi:long-chain acyl-CoA synthetase
MPSALPFADDLDKHGARTALLDASGEPCSYAELASRADAAGERLRSGSLVACLCENTQASVTGYLGALRARAVPLLLGAEADAATLRGVTSRYAPEFAWLPRTRAGEFQSGHVVHEDGRFVLLELPVADVPAPHPDLALLLTTSGSTGSPKLVRLSAGNLSSNAAAIVQVLGIAGDDRPITTLPMQYTYGLSILHTHLLQGCTVLLNEHGFMERAFWDRLREQRATTFGGVPYMYEMLRRLRFSDMPLSGVRMLTQAGGKLTAERARQIATACEAKGIRFVAMYGQAEATARIACLDPALAVAKAGSVGTAIPGGRLRLEDAGQRRIEDEGVEGELVYEGPNVSLGYASSREDLANGDERGGSLRTGDLATRDSDGCYWITGRKQRFVKLFGNRVSLDDVERLLQEEGYDAACGGEDDALRVFTTDASAARAISALLATRTGIHPSAFGVRVVSQIPRTASGKVKYAELA